MSPRTSWSVLTALAIGLSVGGPLAPAMLGSELPRRPAPPLSPTPDDLDRLAAAEAKRARRAARRRGLQ